MSTAHSSAAISSADPGSADTKVCAALLSAWDKTGVVELARVLAKGGTLLLASGGTADALREAGLPVTSIEQYTGMAPAFGGRVKTLHPRVHAGILARRDVPEDMADLHKSGGQPIDLVCVNLYPFEQAVREGRSPEERTEMIDIGGPTLLRAAAKNWRSVAAVSDPADIPSLITELEESGGGLSARTRRQLAARVFETTARYETAIRDDFLDTDSPPECCRPDGMEQHLHAAGDLRYGENPHQSAALYSTADPVSGEDLPGGWRKLAGKSLSYNNWVDLTAAAEVAASLPGNAAVVVKHTNPCGAAVADSQTEAWERALAGDPVSAFGGIAAFNQPVTGKAAAKLTELFLEVVTAPGFSEEAVAELSRKKRLRLVEYDRADLLRDRRDFRTLPGGVCVAQDAGGEDPGPASWEPASVRKPTAEELADLDIAWRLVSAVKSNAIVLVRGGQLLGAGAGQMSRVDSVRLAIEKARSHGHEPHGAVLASDAFFPFADGPTLALEAGVAALVQPGGSRRDGDTVAVVDDAGAAMLFTGRRVFRH